MLDLPIYGFPSPFNGALSMTHVETVRSIIERLGGTWKSDREFSYWQVEENCFVIQAEPFLRRPPGHLWLGFDCALGHLAFAKIVNRIAGDKPGVFVSIKWFQKSAKVENEALLPPAFEALMRDIMLELKAASIDSFIEDFRSTRPAARSVPQLCHLAALAWWSDGHTLSGYLEEFRAGNRRDFVPMITQAMIEGALEIAAERRVIP